MSQTLKAVRGTRDLLPPETALWNRIEQRPAPSSPATTSAKSARPSSKTPPCLPAASAKRPTSSPRRCTPGRIAPGRRSEKPQSLTLRPENTAGVVRAYIEHKLGETGQLAKALLHRPAVPPRAPAEGPLPPVLRRSARRSSARPRPAARAPCATPKFSKCSPPSSTSSASPAGPSNSTPSAPPPTAPATTNSSRRPRPRRRRDVRRLPAPRRHQPPPRARLQSS